MTLVSLWCRPDWSLARRVVQGALAVTAAVLLSRLITVDCAHYLSRPDVIATIPMLGGVIVTALWSALGDTDAHRATGLVGVGALVGILAPTLPLPAVIVLLAGPLRLPRARVSLVAGAVFAVLAVLVGWELPLAVQRLMQPSDFLCR